MRSTDPDFLLHTAEHHFFNHSDALAYQALTQLLAQQRKHPRANELMALLMARAGHSAQALKHFDIASNSDTCSGETLYQYGVLLFQSGKSDKAIRMLKKAAARSPSHFEAQHDLGLALAQSGRQQEALTAFLRAATLKENSAELHFNIGHLHELRRNIDGALASYSRALELHPGFTAAWLNRANLLGAQGRYDEALDHYDHALKLNESYADAWSNKGNLLSHLKRYNEAIFHYEAALNIDSGHCTAWSNLGNALHKLCHYEQALSAYDCAIQLNKTFAPAWAGKGLVLHDQQQFSEALRHFDQAISLDKHYDEARLNKAFTQLCTGDFIQGWSNYEYRWHKNPLDATPFRCIPRLTSLRQTAGRKVLVCCEQGYGDTLQFCRYLPLLNALGAHVTFRAQRQLASLLKNQWDASVISTDEVVIEADYDYQIPLLSLPRLFASDAATLPKATPYITVAAELRHTWLRRLELAEDRPNVAIAFSGNPAHTDDLKRSMTLEHLLPLADICRLHVTQKDVRPEDLATLAKHPEIRDLSISIADFSDTAAILSHMDAVISIDSSLAHLAGALGRPLFLMLPWSAEWRWMIGRSDSPWYPTARLYRQSTPGDWGSVVDAIGTTMASAIRSPL